MKKMFLILTHGKTELTLRKTKKKLKNFILFKQRDNVEWDQELLDQAEAKIKNNSSVLMSHEKAGMSQRIK